MSSPNAESDLREHLNHFRMQQEADRGMRQSTDAGNAGQGLDSHCVRKDRNIGTPRKKPSNKGKRLPTDRCNMSQSKYHEGDDGFIADEVFVHGSTEIRATSTITTTVWTKDQEQDSCQSPSHVDYHQHISTKDPGQDPCFCSHTKPQPASTLRQRPPPLPPKADGKPRVHPIGSTSRPSSPSHRGSLAS
ncbi:hypothetical protein HPB51_026816 [Rhipicephalus microplus]|uniref:Uncharacterized protein n=1 Tax=Rhipicephalus microplus TaxID=6941 RepID=A0A9J6D1M5_RHIMP|nr:hypothetical protein HPB51_026816 [Rhipicephalus microplus]